MRAKNPRENVGEIDPWGQFHQHAYAQILCMKMLWHSSSISPTLPVHSTRCCSQLLHSTKCTKKIRCQFHQRYTRVFFVQVFQQSQNVTSKTMFVRNICTHNFDEIDTRFQFHKCFMHSFFVRKSFFYLRFGFVIFGANFLYTKCVCKTLMKLSSVHKSCTSNVVFVPKSYKANA